MAKEKTAKQKRIRLHEASAENDISYRGPLSYQHFQIFGWLCIVLSVVDISKQGGNALARETTHGARRWSAGRSYPL